MKNVRNKILFQHICIMPVRTSAVFYGRGVPQQFTDFGIVATGNYTVFQPTTPIINSSFFQKGMSYIIYDKK
jgi:hypothetical protein